MIDEPYSEVEVAANRAALERLRHTLLQETKAFISKNRDVCDRLAAALLASEFVDCEELGGHVNRARLPDGWTKFRWPTSMTLLTDDVSKESPPRSIL